MSRLEHFVVLGFATTHAALSAEEALNAASVPVTPIPAPAQISGRCGIALRIPRLSAPIAEETLRVAGIAVTGRLEIEDAVAS